MRSFDGLTAWHPSFGQATQSKIREARIEKCIPRIMEGLALDG